MYKKVSCIKRYREQIYRLPYFVEKFVLPGTQLCIKDAKKVFPNCIYWPSCTDVADLLAIVNRLDATWQLVHHRAFDEVFACARAVCDSASTYLVVCRFNPSTYRGLVFCARLDTEVGFGAR